MVRPSAQLHRDTKIGPHKVIKKVFTLSAKTASHGKNINSNSKAIYSQVLIETNSKLH
jgi:hypothetical protein